MTPRDKLAHALQNTRCAACAGSGVSKTPHPRTGRCRNCRGSGKAWLHETLPETVLAEIETLTGQTIPRTATAL